MDERTSQVGGSLDSGSYEIRLSGRLDARWAAWFDGVTVSAEDDGTTVIRGPIADQAALHGVLQRARDLGLPLVSVIRIGPAGSPPPRHRASIAITNSGQGEIRMNVTASKLINSASLSAVAAGLLFVVIQAIHPADSLASVTTSTWAIVHYVSIAMAILFVIGIGGIYARQVEEVGWLGLAGFLVLSLGLLLTAAFQFVEAAVEPVLASSAPGFVDGVLGLVEGHPSNVDLGALPTLWSVSSALFLAGTLLFGIATLRAGIVPRLASGMFTFGLLLSGPVVALLGAPRLAAVPIGLGLAWMGYALWSEGRRRPSTETVLGRAAPQPDQTAAA
jgi:hypothetical protein